MMMMALGLQVTMMIAIITFPSTHAYIQAILTRWLCGQGPTLRWKTSSLIMTFQQPADVHGYQRMVHRPRTWIRTNEPQNNREWVVCQVGTSFRLFLGRFHEEWNIFFEHCWYCLRHLFHLPTFAKSNVHLYQCDFLSSFHHYKQRIWHFYVLLQNKFHFMNTAKNILQGRQGCSLKGSRCCLCHIVEQIVLWDPAWSSENDPYIRVCNK